VLVDIVAFDGVDEMDALGPLRVLRGTRSLGVHLQSRLVTLVDQPVIAGASGITLTPDGVFRLGEADVVIVPGGGWAARRDQGVYGEVQRGDWLSVLAAARDVTPLMASVCTGAMLLAHAGVLAGRRASTHASAREDLAALGVTVLTDRVVDDGDVVTSGGVTSGIDLALWLLEREFGGELADSVTTAMEYPRVRPTIEA
jgi:transcriptional regulator GlxA family with amidase domain